MLFDKPLPLSLVAIIAFLALLSWFTLWTDPGHINTPLWTDPGHINSPRLKVLAAVAAGDRTAVAAFWNEMKEQGTPLVEAIEVTQAAMSRTTPG